MKRILLAGLAIFAVGILLTAIPSGAQTLYRVKEGDTLWSIADQYLYSATLAKHVQQFNGIPEAKTMQPGINIKFRPEWLKAEPHPVRVIVVVGTASLVRLDGTDSVVEVGSEIKMGDALYTHEQTSVVVRFADDSYMTIRDNALLVFDHISFQEKSGMVDTQLRLERGSIKTKVTPRVHDASRFQIRTRAATLGVRGTDFRVSTEAGDLFRSEVLDGTVAVAGGGVRRRVGAYFGTAAELGQPPIPPRPLLPKPRIISNLDEWINGQFPLLLNWHPVDGAKAYRVMIARDEALTQLVSNEIVTSSNAYPLALRDGTFYIGIRAIDDVGLEGVERRLSLIAPPRDDNTDAEAPIDRNR